LLVEVTLSTSGTTNAIDGRTVRPSRFDLPELGGHARWIGLPTGQLRLVAPKPDATISMSPKRLPLGASHPHLPQAEGARTMTTVSAGVAFADGRQWLERSRPTRRHRPAIAWRGAVRTSIRIYLNADPVYSGRVTVPVFCGTSARHYRHQNESSEIIRLFNSRAFDSIGAKPGDYYRKTCASTFDDLTTVFFTFGRSTTASTRPSFARQAVL